MGLRRGGGSRIRNGEGVCDMESMSPLVEDPGIPLVGRNGGFQMYMHDLAPGVGGGGSSGIMANLKLRKKKSDNVGWRLAKRKELFQSRKVICDFALAFAVVGIFLMVVETELYMRGVYTKDQTPSLLLKGCITISTATLLGFVIWYHVLDVKLFMCDNSLDDWRLAMSFKRVVKIFIELLVYSIHPIPGKYDFTLVTYNDKSARVINLVPIDVFFAIPMFMRFYLLCRVIMLHSKLFTDASSQSLGALNRIQFNFKFLFKSMITLHPDYVLAVLMLSSFVVASWLLRACEHHGEAHFSFLNAMWLISITFLSVGYGDIVPNSYCGRGICVLTGIFGAGFSALVVAVLARRLELSCSEKYVHNFVVDVELDKRCKVAAANIIKAGWFVYKNKRAGKMRLMRRYQRKLLKIIHNIREVKQDQRRLADRSISMVELSNGQIGLQDMISRVESRQAELDSQVASMDTKLNTIDTKLDKVCSLVELKS